MPKSEPIYGGKYPNLRNEREKDRQLHYEKSREAGMTRKQASDHAEEHIQEQDRRMETPRTAMGETEPGRKELDKDRRGDQGK